MWNTFPPIEQQNPAGTDFNGHTVWSHYTASLSVCPPRPVVLANGKKQNKELVHGEGRSNESNK
jgi:hypothetical protein